MTGTRRWAGVLVAALLAALVWWFQGPSGEGSPEPRPAGDVAVVELADLPPQARETVALIDAGGPYPYEQDDGTFFNREELLPDEPTGFYREYTVETPGSDDRGARRIVSGEDGTLWWTDDHYASFQRIDRGG